MGADDREDLLVGDAPAVRIQERIEEEHRGVINAVQTALYQLVLLSVLAVDVLILSRLPALRHRLT